MNAKAKAAFCNTAATAVAVVAVLGLASCGHESNLATPEAGAQEQGDGGLTPMVFTGAAAGEGGVLGSSPGLVTGVSPAGSCLSLGAACTSNGDCCSGDCNHTCQYPACTPDNAACVVNGDCCSQTCSGGKCAALNSSCDTIGNPCTSAASCCSHFCASNGTCQSSSFCGQPGDACSVNAGCCTGTCVMTAGKTLGTCALSTPPGPANCGLADGQLCGGAGTNGTVTVFDGSIPPCGGPCCSRACAPWGPTGVLICQPASGCHVVGDLCMKDTDCCGSVGYPGGSGHPVTCVISTPGSVGICRNPEGCKPDGDVCKLKTMSCNSSCDCCAGNCETQDTCHQDNVGVPRCSPAMCVTPGQACASSADCCGGVPCVPNPAGNTPPLICYSALCVGACGGCTTTADCCQGTSCVIPSGALYGICGPCGGPPQPPPDAGPAAIPDSGSPPQVDAGGPPPMMDAGFTPPPPPPPPSVDAGCGMFGQICQSAADCCAGLPCTLGDAGVGRCGTPYIPR